MAITIKLGLPILLLVFTAYILCTQGKHYWLVECACSSIGTLFRKTQKENVKPKEVAAILDGNRLPATHFQRKIRRKNIESDGIGEMFLNSLTSEEITETDLTALEEAVRGITFDEYRENISCKMLEGIKINDFETVVRRIATRNHIPDDKADSILDGKYSKRNKEIVREFVFDKGTPGKVLYGRFVTIKRDDSTIDLAYSLFHLKFKLSPKRIETIEDKWFLYFFRIGSQVHVRFEERNLSQKDKQDIENFFRAKALDGFRKEYPALNERNRNEL